MQRQEKILGPKGKGLMGTFLPHYKNTAEYETVVMPPVCVESNKEAAIKKLYEIATDARDEDDSVKLMRLPSKYPQGAEKVMSQTFQKVKNFFKRP